MKNEPTMPPALLHQPRLILSQSGYKRECKRLKKDKDYLGLVRLYQKARVDKVCVSGYKQSGFWKSALCQIQIPLLSRKIRKTLEKAIEKDHAESAYEALVGESKKYTLRGGVKFVNHKKLFWYVNEARVLYPDNPRFIVFESQIMFQHYGFDNGQLNEVVDKYPHDGPILGIFSDRLGTSFDFGKSPSPLEKILFEHDENWHNKEILTLTSNYLAKHGEPKRGEYPDVGLLYGLLIAKAETSPDDLKLKYELIMTGAFEAMSEKNGARKKEQLQKAAAELRNLERRGFDLSNAKYKRFTEKLFNGIENDPSPSFGNVIPFPKRPRYLN